MYLFYFCYYPQSSVLLHDICRGICSSYSIVIVVECVLLCRVRFFEVERVSGILLQKENEKIKGLYTRLCCQFV